jgi:hypothetical protein
LSFEPLHETLTLDFPGGALWQAIDKDDPARDLELRKAWQEEFAQFERCRRRPFSQDHRCGDIFAEARMGHSECGGLRDAWMTLQGVVDFRGRDFLASPVDHLGLAAMNGEEAVAVEASDIAGPKPSIDEGSTVELGRVEVA